MGIHLNYEQEVLRCKTELVGVIIKRSFFLKKTIKALFSPSPVKAT
jgi:hypothetical protein